MNLKSKKTLYEVVALGIILIIILVVLIIRPGSGPVVAPTSANVPTISTEFDTSSLDQINQRQNTRSVLTPLNTGKDNPFRF